jgi:hypothetical protein
LQSRVYLNNPTITSENINGFVNMNRNGTFVSGSTTRSETDDEETDDGFGTDNRDPRNLSFDEYVEDDNVSDVITTMWMTYFSWTIRLRLIKMLMTIP